MLKNQINDSEWYAYRSETIETIVKNVSLDQAIQLAEDLARLSVRAMVAETADNVRQRLDDEGGDDDLIYDVIYEVIDASPFVIYTRYHQYLVDVWCWDYGGVAMLNPDEEDTTAAAYQALTDMVIAELNID
jgi:hypothetical protein